MPTAPCPPAPMTTDSLADALHAGGHRATDGRPIKPWIVRRVFEGRLVGEAVPRIGRYRVITPAQLPAALAAMRRAGYLADDRPDRPVNSARAADVADPPLTGAPWKRRRPGH